MKLIIILAILFTSTLAPAQLKVAFIKIYKPDCSVLFLEPKFEYSHVAISYKDGWINAHPKHGVQFTKTLEELDFPKVDYIIKEHPLMPEISYAEIKGMLGKPYNNKYTWSSNYSYYCTELVAKLLAIPPSPMKFDPKIWPKEYQKLNGRLGMSPSLLLHYMTQLGFVSQF